MILRKKNKYSVAEHVMIVDLMRNDLGIVGSEVKVEKFRYVEKIKAKTFHNRPKHEQLRINLSRTKKNGNYFRKKYFDDHPENKNSPGVLYYFNIQLLTPIIENSNHRKLGQEVFGYRKQRYNIRDIELTHDNVYSCFIMEQQVLKTYDKYRVITELTTETFNKDIRK